MSNVSDTLCRDTTERTDLAMRILISKHTNILTLTTKHDLYACRCNSRCFPARLSIRYSHSSASTILCTNTVLAPRARLPLTRLISLDVHSRATRRAWRARSLQRLNGKNVIRLIGSPLDMHS